MGRNPETIAAIDLGTHRCCCVITRVEGPRQLDVLGVGSRKTEGIRKGKIVNLEVLVGSIRGAIQAAESMAGVTVESVVATVPAAQVRSFTSRGVVTVSGRDRVVTRRDLERVLETVRTVQIPEGQTILHTLPQEYALDGQGEIQDPVGMTGQRLEASVHVVTVPQQAAQHVVAAINRAEAQVASLVFPLLAAAEAVLTPEEKEQGVFLVDIGGGTTDVALWERGAPWFTASIPIAGDLVTNDISIGLRTPFADAENVKRTWGSTIPLEGDDDVPIEVPGVGDGKPKIVRRSVLSQIIGPRVQEIFELVRDRLDRAGLAARARAGAVLVGGSANLDGMVETAEEILGMPVRIGVPAGFGGLADDIRLPGFATPVGLARWELVEGRRHRAQELGRRRNRGLLGGLVRSVTSWMGEVF